MNKSGFYQAATCCNLRIFSQFGLRKDLLQLAMSFALIFQSTVIMQCRLSKGPVF
jgi:hypothetical protein